MAAAGQHIAETTIPRNRQPTPTDSLRARTPIPVIARIVWKDREEWWPAQATEWNDSIVHVTWRDARTQQDEWIPASDVRRSIVTPRTND